LLGYAQTEVMGGFQGPNGHQIVSGEYGGGGSARSVKVRQFS